MDRSQKTRSEDSASKDSSSKDAASPTAGARPDDQLSAGSASPSARSGDFSQDPALNPEQLFQVIGREENAERVSSAMRAFLVRGDTETFEQAVAVFVRSARARGEPVERVLAVLIELAEAREGVGSPHDRTPTDLRRLVLRGVLLAFYGEAAPTGTAHYVERRRRGERRRSGEEPSSRGH
jgi:hypothetical protein